MARRSTKTFTKARAQRNIRIAVPDERLWGMCNQRAGAHSEDGLDQFMNKTPPWVGIGKPIPKDATIEAILKLGGLDWTVSKHSLKSDSGALVLHHFSIERDMDKQVLDLCGSQYEPMQNIDALKRFKDICDEGYMKIFLAGSLMSGKRVFAVAQMREEFTLPSGEVVHGNVLMSHSHMYGKATAFYLMPIHATHFTTFVQPLGTCKERGRVLHYGLYKATDKRAPTKEVFDACKFALTNYEAEAKTITENPCSRDNLVRLSMRVFYPGTSDYQVILMNAQRVIDYFEQCEGKTLWDAFMAICYVIDHKMGDDRDFSLHSAWFGPRAVTKATAFNILTDLTPL